MTTGPLTREIAHAIERIEAEATADMLRAAPFWYDEFHLDLGMHRIGAAAYGFHLEEIDFQTFNRVLCLGVGEPATPAHVDAVLDLYRHTWMRFPVMLSPYAEPATLPGWLRQRGMRVSRRDRWVKFYRGVEPPPETPTDFRVECIDKKDASLWVVTAHDACYLHRALQLWMSLVVGRPGWRHYLAYDGDFAVACGALYVRDGVGWLGFGGTRRGYQKRGAQSAIIAARIRDAAAMGARLLTVETEEDVYRELPNHSYRNMLRLGFRIAYLRPHFRPDDDVDIEHDFPYGRGL